MLLLWLPTHACVLPAPLTCNATGIFNAAIIVNGKTTAGKGVHNVSLGGMDLTSCGLGSGADADSFLKLQSLYK